MSHQVGAQFNEASHSSFPSTALAVEAFPGVAPRRWENLHIPEVDLDKTGHNHILLLYNIKQFCPFHSRRPPFTFR